jgi:hypothetical protein
VRTLAVVAALALFACSTTAVTVPRRAFEDIPVPREWVSYSRDAVITETPTITTAKLVYFAKTSVDATLADARRLLLVNGWAETKSERFVNPEKFPGVWAAFAKGDDTCRVTVIEGQHATHVEYAVARVNPPR